MSKGLCILVKPRVLTLLGSAGARHAVSSFVFLFGRDLLLPSLAPRCRFNNEQLLEREHVFLSPWWRAEVRGRLLTKEAFQPGSPNRSDLKMTRFYPAFETTAGLKRQHPAIFQARAVLSVSRR